MLAAGYSIWKDAMTISLAYASLLTLVYLLLSFNVSRQRRRCLVSLGDGDQPPLRAAMRAHGNFAEYVPLALLLLALDEAAGVSAPWLHAVGAMLLAGRILHPFGIAMPAPNPARVLGILLTWLALLLAALLGLMRVFA